MREGANTSAAFPRRRRLQRKEDPVQRSILAWLRQVLPPGSLVFHVPNGGKRSLSEARRFKGLGVVAGIPDLVAIVGGGRPPILIGGEVKAVDGRAETDKQAEIGAQWRALGGFWGVWRSIDDARRTVLEAGVPIREAKQVCRPSPSN